MYLLRGALEHAALMKQDVRTALDKEMGSEGCLRLMEFLLPAFAAVIRNDER